MEALTFPGRSGHRNEPTTLRFVPSRGGGRRCGHARPARLGSLVGEGKRGTGVCLVDDERARFEAEVEPLLPRLHRLCMALCRDQGEAEDLLQDGLVRAYLHRASYQGRGSFFGWILGIIRNQFVESRRAAARRRSLLETVIEGATSVLGCFFMGGTEPLDPESQACRSQEAALMLRCLHELPEKFRLVVLLCDIEELSHEEVASILGIPVGTVKSRHSRGRAQLGAAFEALSSEQAQVVSAGGRP